MRTDHSEKRRFLQRQSDRVLLIIVSVLALLTLALNIAQRAGLCLIDGNWLLYLPVALVFVLLGWGAYALIRRISRSVVKTVVAAVAVLVGLVAFMLVFTYVGFVATVTIPQRYAALQSPSGEHKLVVMRGIDPDEERIEQRRNARLAADPEGDPEITVADWGYIYRAYPRVLRLFYRQSDASEGEIYLTYDGPAPQAQAPEEGEAAPEGDASEEADAPAQDEAPAEGEAPVHGTLMVEWLDDGATVHFFVDHPGAAEGGECFVRF